MTRYGHKFVKGKWHKVDGKIELCKWGFHASENVIDAMGFVPAEVLAKVEVRGDSQVGDDKQVWSEMRLVKTYKWTKKDSVSLAIYAAEMVLENFEKKYPDDLRPRQAIEAAKKILKHDTEENRSAAMSAAWSARSAAWSARSAWSAARSAESAARSAESEAESAAWSAAMSAARSAARSAESAAESAALKVTKQKLHDFVIKRAKLLTML